VRVCPVGAITGEKKAKHVIDHELCIACGACGRICPHASVLDPSGALCTMEKRSSWKKPAVDEKACVSCMVCIETCPVNCLALSAAKDSGDPHGYPYLKDAGSCIACGFCAAECPVAAIRMVQPPA